MIRVRKYIVVALGITALLITSCKKHTVEIPQSNDPVFRADGSFDGEAFSLVAHTCIPCYLKIMGWIYLQGN